MNEPTNAQRAAIAARAVELFAAHTGQQDELKHDPRALIVDLIANLAHYADALGLVGIAFIHDARDHYMCETGVTDKPKPASADTLPT